MLLCNDGTYYTGSTPDIEKRLRQHNGDIKGGAKYTRGRKPVKLIYTETHKTKSEALKRENELKQLSHKEKEGLYKKL